LSTEDQSMRGRPQIQKRQVEEESSLLRHADAAGPVLANQSRRIALGFECVIIALARICRPSTK